MVDAVLLPAFAAFVLLATAPALAGSKPDAPPPGVVPATVKLQTVLDAADTAVGSQAHRSITDVEMGTIDAYGIAGTYRDVYTSLHEDADYHRSVSLPPLSWQEGQYDGIPLVGAQFGPAKGSKFLLNDIADGITLYSSFWKAGNGLTLDNTLLDAKTGDLRAPWETVVFKSVVVAGMQLGGVTTDLVAAGAPLSRDDIDGEFGQSFMTLFHIYLDYPDQKAYFVPSAETQKELDASPSGSRST